MTLYRFHNTETGAYRNVRAYRFYDAMQKCPSSRGWVMTGFTSPKP